MAETIRYGACRYADKGYTDKRPEQSDQEGYLCLDAVFVSISKLGAQQLKSKAWIDRNSIIKYILHDFCFAWSPGFNFFQC